MPRGFVKRKRGASLLKIAVIYATKTGTARECAERLGRCLQRQEVNLFELGKDKIPPLGGFDTVVLGGAVRFGKADKRLRRFLKERERELKTARTGYFICCAFADLAEEYIGETFGKELLDRAVFAENFGGELKPAKQKNIFAKLAVRAMINDIEENGDSDDESEARTMPGIVPEAIAGAAEKIIKPRG